MSHDDREGPQNFRSLSYQAIQTLGRAFPALLRLALLPFLLSVGVVILARWVGPPLRYGFDLAHGVFVLSYVTSVSRVAQSHVSKQLVTGPSFLSLAVPRPQWPGLKPLGGMIAEAALLMIPTALILFLLSPYIGGLLFGIDSLALDVISLIVPEFLLNTLLGLVIGAGMAKIAAAKQL